MKKMIKKILPVIMSLAMVLSLMPTTVFALTSDEIGTIADGIYTGSANVSDVEGAAEDQEDWEWDDYTVNVSVTVEDGAITAIDTSGTAVPNDSSSYWNRATVSTSSRTSVTDQIIEANSTEVDGVSKATYASEAVILAVEDALEDEVQTEDDAITLEAGTYTVPVSASDYVSAMSVEFGGVVADTATAVVAEDGSVSLTLTFQTIENVMGSMTAWVEDFYSPSDDLVTTTTTIEDETGTEHTSLDTVTFTVSGIEDTYELSYYLCSNMMNFTRTVTLTVDWANAEAAKEAVSYTTYDYTLYYKHEATANYDGYFGQMVDGTYTSGAVSVAENEDGTYTVVIVVDGTSAMLSDVGMIFDDDVVYTSETDEAGYITYTLILDDITATLDFQFTYTIAAMGRTNTHQFQIVFEGGTYDDSHVYAESTDEDGNVSYACKYCGDEYVYVLMNVPYSDFYSVVGDDGVDSVSSATLNKTRSNSSYTLAGGSYHVNSDGSDITGLIYYVYIAESSLEGLNEITDDSSVTISVTNRGTTTETTYEGSDALVEAESYSYYIVDETPSAYLVAESTDDGITFTEIVAETTTITGVSCEFTTDTTYGDYQLNVDEETVSSFSGDDLFVSAVTVNTSDGSVYGMRHVENIWSGYELAWSTGHTTTVHGCSVDYDNYADMEGKTITSVTYYTTEGIYVLELSEGVYVTPYTTDVEAELTGSTTIAVTGIPEDAENLSVTLSYTSGKSSVEVEASYDAETGVITAAEALLDDTTYTITITADNYAFESLSVDVSYVYVQMNVPYNDFFAAYGVDDAAVWEVEDGLDAVSTATTSKFLGTTGLAAGTYNDGTYILGVVLNVAMLESTYEALAAYAVDADSLASAGSYYFTVLDEETEYYSVLDYADGTYSFAAIQDSSLTTEYLSVDELTLDSSYGDYQISIVGLTNASGVQISAESTDEDGNDTTEYQEVTVYTAILNFTDADGNSYSYGTTALENLWFGTKVTYLEVAWSIEEGQGLTNHGGEAFYQFAGINGATLTGVVLVTDQGVITVEADVDLPEYTSASATNKSDGTIEITGIPEDAENVAVTLSYTEGSGRSAVTTTVAAAYENGILTITDADSVTEGTVYTISISADNYAFTDIEIEYGYEYVLMNIPYEVFYAVLGTENVDGVDAISAATSSKYNYYNLAGGSYNSGDADIDGVTYAVKLSAADYEAFVALGYTLVTEDAETVTVVNQRADYDISGIDTLFVQGDYAYADIDAQDSYLTASVADGVITFSALTGEAAEVYVTYDFYTDTSYGDYQLDIDISDYVDGAGEIAAATVNTTDGCTYALLHVEEIWTGGKLAWSTGHTTTVHNNAVNYELYEGMEGKTIESVTYYMTDGTIYTFILSESEETTDEDGNTTETSVASPAYVIPYYTGEIAAESASKSEIVLSGIDELEELTTITGVTVTYSVGSGRNSVTYTVEDAVYEDGVITGTFEAGVTYTVAIETEGYAQIEIEATVTEYSYTLYYKCEDSTSSYGRYFGQIVDGIYESGAVQITANEDGTYTVVIVADGTSSMLSDVAMIFDDDVVYTSETDEAGYITYTLTLDDITETLDFSFTYTIAAMGMTNTHAFQIVFEGGTWSGHDIVFVEEEAADCGNTGAAAHYECSRCGAYFEVSYSVTVASADELTAIELTVGDPMNLTVTAYVTASGSFVQEDGTTASMMASYVENVSVTANEDGTYTVTFALTDEAAAMVEAISADMTATEADSADYVIAATGEHSYEVTESVSSTETEDGYIIYTCSVCGDTYTETIPAAGTEDGEDTEGEDTEEPDEDSEDTEGEDTEEGGTAPELPENDTTDDGTGDEDTEGEDTEGGTEDSDSNASASYTDGVITIVTTGSEMDEYEYTVIDEDGNVVATGTITGSSSAEISVGSASGTFTITLVGTSQGPWYGVETVITVDTETGSDDTDTEGGEDQNTEGEEDQNTEGGEDQNTEGGEDQNTEGDTGAGDTGAGDTGTGDTEAGDTDTGDTEAGDTNTGDTGTGDTDTGDTGTGDTDAGDTDAGDTGTGDTDAGDTDAGDTGTGDADTGDTGTGDTEAGDTETGDIGTSDTGSEDTGSDNASDTEEAEDGSDDTDSGDTDSDDTETSDDDTSDDESSTADVGDSSNMALWMGLLALAVMAIVCALASKRKFN